MDEEMFNRLSDSEKARVRKAEQDYRAKNFGKKKQKSLTVGQYANQLRQQRHQKKKPD